MIASMIRILAVLLLCLTAAVGCNRSNDAEVAKVKAEAEAVKAKAEAEVAKAKAEAEAAKAEAAKAAQAQPMVDVDRRAAEWAIRAGAASLSILADGVRVEIPKGGKIPDGPVTVLNINLSQCGGATDDGTDRLKGLKSLKGLDIGYTSIKRLDFLEGMENLEYLVLSQTAINDASLAHVKGLKKLQLLYLHTYWGEGEVSDAGIENLKALTELRRVEIFGTRTTDAGLKHLSGLTNLEYLAIGSVENKSAITDEGLAHLAGLSKLNNLKIITSQVTDAGLEHIKKLSNLQSLELVKTRITEAGIASLKEALPNCKVEGVQ